MYNYEYLLLIYVLKYINSILLFQNNFYKMIKLLNISKIFQNILWNINYNKIKLFIWFLILKIIHLNYTQLINQFIRSYKIYFF